MSLATTNPLFLSLFAGAGGSSEVAGNGYARLSITNDATVFHTDGSGNATSIVPLATTTATGTGWGRILSIGFYDLSTGGTLLAHVDIHALTVGPNQGVSFIISALGYTAANAITPATPGLYNVARSLYLYENLGIQPEAIPSRALYTYENLGIEAQAVTSRSLYTYENLGIEALIAGLTRDLYLYEALHDSPVTPWLLELVPNAQYAGGAVTLYGDGLGQFSEVGAGATLTASSTNGTNIPANVIGRTSATVYWQSNDGTGAWIRFTFGTAQTLYGLALEDIPGASADVWGTPLFRFSDGGADVTGGSAVPIPQTTTRPAEYPVGGVRTLYVLPAERTGITWVEVRVASGGAGSARGLSQVWVLADQGQAAEGSIVKLIAETCGVVGAWLNRSPGWWPANGGGVLAPAVTFTVPSDGVSGLVTVTET